MEVFNEFTHTFLVAIKIAIWLFLILYILFAGVVLKQVRVMIETLEVGFERPIRIIAVFHFIISVAVFILALIIL